MSLTKATYSMINGASINILDYGAYNDGTHPTETTAAIQAAFNSGKSIYIPVGTYACNSNITVSATTDFESYHIFGDGRESKLVFSSGGLVFSGKAAKNSVLERFYVEMSGTGQIGIDFVDTSVSSAPTRWAVRDIWVRSTVNYTNTGVRFRGGWIGSVFNPIVQNCAIGIQIPESPNPPGVGFNSLSFFGGEIQGNTTGLEVENVLSLNFFGTAIEGNRGNGVLLKDGCRNVMFDGVYFEANGIDAPATTNDVRIEVSTGLATLYSVSFRSTNHLSAGGAQTAIWVNKCSALTVDPQCSFNGYTTRLDVQDIAAGVTTGSFSAIAPNTGIGWTNNSNAFGALVEREYSTNGFTMADAVTSTAPDVYFALPSTAAKLGSISLMYTAAATGDVFFRVTPIDIATNTAAATLDIITPAVIGRNLATATFNFDSRSLRGKNVALQIQRLGSSGLDTNTGTVNLNTATISSNQ